MKINKLLCEVSDKLTKKVNTNLIQYVDRYIDDSMSNIEKAVVIYLCLGDVLHYSPKYNFRNISKYITSVRDIDLLNNDIICKNWAILYSRLLSKYGILARVVKKRFHYFVEIVDDGIIYKADATAYASYNDHYTMSDISKIKVGFKIQKFKVSNTVDQNDTDRMYGKSLELESIIDKVYSKQNRKVIEEERINKSRNKVMRLIEKNSEKVGFMTPEDIYYRIKVLNRFWKLNTIENPVERMQLFNYFYSTLFYDCDIVDIRIFNIYSFTSNGVNINKLIAFDIYDKYFYYFDDGKEFKRYSKEELINEFFDRNVRLSEFTEIPGIFTGLELLKVRM